jgi:integrase
MGRDGYPWYRKGKKCWYFWQDGRQIRLAPDKEEALRLWHEIQADPEPRDEESGETVSVAVDRYLVEVAGLLKPETVLRKRRLLGRFKADMGGRLTTSVTVKEVQGWLAGHKGWNPSTRRLAGQMLSALFRWCGRPLEGLRLPPPRSRGAETLVDPDAHARLLEAAPPCYRDALTVLHATGCRPGELCRAEAGHLHSQALVLTEHKTDETGRARVILLPPAALDVVSRLAGLYPAGKLFRTTKGKPLDADRLRNWVFKTRRRLGLPRVMPYSYRHTLATDALVAGVPDAQVAEILGHTGTRTLHFHYAHLVAKTHALRGALDRVRGDPGRA